MSTLVKTQNGEKEYDTIKFFREQIMLHAQATDLLTLTDTDEHKLPALNKLFHHIYGLRAELATVNIHPRAEKGRNRNLYLLTDKQYQDFDPFQIRLRCPLFDTDWTYALHAGFEFFLQVTQDGYQGRGEIADWINIYICHMDTVPSSLASRREHVRALKPFVSAEHCYFEDIPMAHTSTVSFARMADGLSFKTDLFNQSVEDACSVLRKIVSRKDLLSIVEEK